MGLGAFWKEKLYPPDRALSLVYVRAHTQTTWVLDVSPGVRQKLEEPEASSLRSTGARYTW